MYNVICKKGDGSISTITPVSRRMLFQDTTETYCVVYVCAYVTTNNFIIKSE